MNVKPGATVKLGFTLKHDSEIPTVFSIGVKSQTKKQFAKTMVAIAEQMRDATVEYYYEHNPSLVPSFVNQLDFAENSRAISLRLATQKSEFDLESLIDELTDEDFIREQGIFNYRTIEMLKQQLHSNNPDESVAKLWAIIVFQHWWKKYIAEK